MYTASRLVAVIVCGLVLLPCGCKKKQGPETETVRAETPEDEILRVGKRWQATEEARGFQSPPSPISVFDTRVQSVVVFSRGEKTVVEGLSASEDFELRDGSRVHCEGKLEVHSRVVYGRRQGEAAIQLERPRVRIPRRCSGGVPPDASLSLPRNVARFVLRDDQLVAVEPPLEKRVYLPIP
ncbi:MAG: hypothetical protein KC766_38930 [Myxococcales bacterium]|nr:hypothetical protein [Myxococcales bacterium]